MNLAKNQIEFPNGDVDIQLTNMNITELWFLKLSLEKVDVILGEPIKKFGYSIRTLTHDNITYVIKYHMRAPGYVMRDGGCADRSRWDKETVFAVEKL